MLLRTEAFRSTQAVATVQPSIIRVAEIGSVSQIDGDWSSSGTFDASGIESNRLLVIFSLVFDSGAATAPSTTSLTIGGSAATQAFGFINATDGARALASACHYRIAPANDASLAVAWNFAEGTTAGIISAKVYGVLLQDVHQSDPIPTGAQVNNTNSLPELFIDITWSTSFDTSLLLGGFLSRGSGTGPHTTRNGSNIEIAGNTGAGTALDVSASVASLAGGSAGSKTLGVTLATGDDRGGTAVEVRAA